ncbi:MAG: winged helix-turn-helix domain-containing protein [Thermoleophilia bacterium]
MEIRSKIWLEIDGKCVFSKGRVILLEAIDQYGSINRAAAETGISYRRAWGYIKAMEKRLGIELVETKTGGTGGGGAMLTDEARRFLVRYEALEAGISELVDKRFGDIFKAKKTGKAGRRYAKLS